jgi:uncharacterized UPF0160 family protein
MMGEGKDDAEAKRAKTGELTMGTHSGTFQADEAMGIWMLRQLPKWSGATLVRSRDLEVRRGESVCVRI